MGDMINGRTPEEIKRGIKCHVSWGDCSTECPYDDVRNKPAHECIQSMTKDALALIEHLEAKQPKWTGVRERLPERHVPVLGLIEKYGSKARINNVVIWDGISWVRDTGVYYEDPAGEVTHWMPLPEPPEEEGYGQTDAEP